GGQGRLVGDGGDGPGQGGKRKRRAPPRRRGGGAPGPRRRAQRPACATPRPRVPERAPARSAAAGSSAGGGGQHRLGGGHRASRNGTATAGRGRGWRRR